MTIRRSISTAALLSTVLLLGGLTCVAYATEPVWVSKEHTLKLATETRTVIAKFSKLKARWEDKATPTKFEVECKKASGEVEIKGGFPGTDKVKSLAFEECSLTKGGTGCKLTAGGVTSEELPGWPSELKAATDSLTGVRFSLVLTGCEKGTFNKTWIFKGNLKPSLKNEAGKVKLTLPTLAGGAEALEVEGGEGSLSGSGEFEEKEGTLAAEEATARWYNEANERFAEGARENVLIENSGTTTIATKLEGVEVEISCPVLEGEGWIENKIGGGGINLVLAVYKKCTVPKPGGGCKLTKESFRFVPEPNSAKLVYKGTSIVDEIKFLSVLEDTKIKMEGCEKAGLNTTYTWSGTLIGEPINEKSSIKFTSTSGSALKMGGETTTFVGEDKMELETGGKIQVG